MSDTCNKRNTLKALDCIGRQAAIEALEREKVYMSGFQSDGTIIHPFEKYNRGLEDGIEALKVLPSAQPERWIPVNEREPDTSEHVLVTLKWDEDDYEVTELDWGVDKACGGRFTKLATAWMPLPKPYTEEGQDEE